MAFDKKVLLGICRTDIGKGHDFQSMIVDMLKAPHAGNTLGGDPVFIAQYKVVCTCCGATPEEASTEMRPARSRSGTRKGKIDGPINAGISPTPEALE
jgi:hypothetical protein